MLTDDLGGLQAMKDTETLEAPVGNAQLVVNETGTGSNLLSVIKRQMLDCQAFDFCVAFVAESGLQPLVETFSELKKRGIRGRLLTSTYLNFNTPAVFRKLLEYDNIEVRIYQGNMHAKGYLFNSGDASTVIVGSSNLTQGALTCNKEWNVLFRTFEGSEMLGALRAEFDLLWDDAATATLSESWIRSYEDYRKPVVGQGRSAFKEAPEQDFSQRVESKKIHPNRMQALALEALSAIHKRQEPRALLVSATGTGKTYLSAFDIEKVKPRRVLFLAHRKRILSASMVSYERLLAERYSYAMYESGKRCDHATCVFAMCSTVSRRLAEFDPEAFDYIVVDEAHRTGSGSYQKIMNHFRPRFFFGMTATPNRTDGYDVFALFNHVIAYQITLQDALANEMLAPFHYFGIADLQIDDEAVDDPALFSKLTSEERVRHITGKIEEYTVDKVGRRGLIFCNRNDEALELSTRFNELGYRTIALSGKDGDEDRNAAIAKLESGEIEYIFSVDIFNEGIDIPSVNQIIMLRRTESAIVFVQQLGRGLRKAHGKDYALILDFIGNYQKNFFVPIALSGDHTYNKDNLRAVLKEGSTIIPGCSTVSFDKVSEARIYRAIDGGDFSAARFIKAEYTDLRRMLGRIPRLRDFDQNGSIDPLLIFKKFDSYHGFLSKYEHDYTVRFDDEKCGVLRFLSQKLASGKRFEDLFMLKHLVESHSAATIDLIDAAGREYRKRMHDGTIRSAAAFLYGDFMSSASFMPLVLMEEGECRLTRRFAQALTDAEFKDQVLEVIEFGIDRHYLSYGTPYKDTSFVLYAKYTYEEVCRLLRWEKNVNGQNIGGYKYDAPTNTFPVFINYDKDPSISETIKYEDRFVNEREIIAISKQPRNLDSPEIERLRAWPGNSMKSYLFVRKNKNDGISKEFYFLGEIYPTGSFVPITIAGKSAIEISYRLDVPVKHDLYEFITSDLNEDLAGE